MFSCVVCKKCRDGHPSHEKDSIWAWMVCFAAATNLAFTTGLLYSFGVLLPVFMDHFKESRERTAWVGSLPISLVPFSALFASSLANRFGCRAVSMTGCVAYALSLLTASFAENLTILYLAFSIIGIGAWCALVSGLVMVRKCFDRRGALALGIGSTGQGLGTMVLSQVLQSLTDAVGWRSALRIMAGALVLNALLALLFDSEMDTENSDSSEQLSSEEDGQRPRESKRFTFHCSVWKVPSVIVLTVTAAFFMFGRSIIYVLLVKYSVDRGMSSAASSRLILFMGINIVLGRFVCGFLCSIERLDNWFILQGMAITNGVSTVLLVLAKNYEWLVAYSLIFGFCEGAMAAAVNIIALTSVEPSKAGSAFGNVLLTTSFVTLVGPPLSEEAEEEKKDEEREKGMKAKDNGKSTWISELENNCIQINREVSDSKLERGNRQKN
ncbi:Monocarboxylate transporter 12 [Stylophora pistillata]|uniref:Monocarboxylate transporter 12 n=1 Tax=Stylophora pistillata TaxID=50429 RepID=A0A2B4RHC4_STYPI|nr:Monocarboxylate transporter 12 [Stylophora pistillata]